MAAITNGIALDATLRSYCGTFLIFSDYLRPSLRLAALMGVPSLFVFTHDSIYLGEDGPTHQPIEQLDALRAIPNVHVFRPADGLETAAAYAWIARHTTGRRCSRCRARSCPSLAARARAPPRTFARGAYVVRDPAIPQVVLVASGSEVSLACDAAEKLHAENVAARVVSLPCLELFLAQPEAWRDALIPPTAARGGDRGGARAEPARARRDARFVYGIDRFGASAIHRSRRVLRFTPDRVLRADPSHLRPPGEGARSPSE
jgi:transketolase